MRGNLSFTSYNLDTTGVYRQSLFSGVVNVSLLGYNLIILYSSFSFFYYPAAGPSFSLLSTLNSITTIAPTDPKIANCKIDVYLMSRLTANVLLQTLGTNTIFVKCKLDVYLMSTMLENYATAEMTNALIQTLGTNSMIVKCKLDVYLISTKLKNCCASVTVSLQILGTNKNDCERQIRCLSDVFTV